MLLEVTKLPLYSLLQTSSTTSTSAEYSREIDSATASVT